ncbi:uncharacterized protein LOC108658402 [Drosophila navojoa]|uniref:uncharacterized protein LOC108658402 n=1 Tax=Drosophila navojoa TaxID=7232 RepID=UPI0008468E2C|nr:uncharacterized protein LOC108658402 [Drosophila navojoa]
MRRGPRAGGRYKAVGVAEHVFRLQHQDAQAFWSMCLTCCHRKFVSPNDRVVGQVDQEKEHGTWPADEATRRRHDMAVDNQAASAAEGRQIVDNAAGAGGRAREELQQEKAHKQKQKGMREAVADVEAAEDSRRIYQE